MRNKRNFNNLFDSICITLLFLESLTFYVGTILFGVINSKEGTNPIVTLIISSIVFGLMITITIILIIKGCYGYWILLENSIVSKKLFSKRTIIKFTEIEKVEKKIVPAVILGIYKGEAYIISSGIKRIIILINKNKKTLKLLEKEISKFIN